MVRRYADVAPTARLGLSDVRRVVAVVVFLMAAPAVSAGAQEQTIVQIDLADIIHPVSREYVADGLNRADEIGASAVLIRLDTPGGLLDSTREMVEDILASPVPVITWVGPSGVRAASAGFFILLSGDLALMASGTNTGASSPVSMFGDIPETMEKKVVSDTSAFLRSYVAIRGRNAPLAERAVTEAEAFTADEAFNNNLIDGIAPSVADILEMFDDREVTRFDGTPERLSLRGSRVELFEMTSRQRLLSAIMNPNVALLLGVVGLLGLYVEVTHPGMIAPGVIGGISLLLALYAFNVLPVNLTGLLLILLAVALFVVEATVPSHGVLAMGGIVAMVAGGVMLVEGPIPELQVQLGTVLALAIPMALLTIFLVRLVLVAHRKKSVTGRSGMLGATGRAISEIHESGRVMIHGEYWTAHSGVPVPQGARVRVVGVEGLDLEVEKEEG
jgi:membrane-bound serine protease (ClpP class)